MIFGTAFKGNLELAAQILIELVSHQIAKQGLGIGSDIERFGCRSSGPIASRNVAHRIPTGFAGSNSSVSEKPQQVRSFVQVDVIDLCVFPRGEMDEATPESIGRVS